MSTTPPIRATSLAGRAEPFPAELARLLRRGATRLRIDRGVAVGLAGFAAGLAASLVLAIAIRVRPLMLPEEAIPWVAGMIGGGGIVGALVGGLWPAPRAFVARRTDQACGLRERVSTALEMHALPGGGFLVADQLRDAAASVANVGRMPRLGPAVMRRHLGVAGGLAVAVTLALWLPNPQSDTVRERRADAAAVEAARDDVVALAAEVAARPDLDPATQAALTARLDELLDALDPGSMSGEDAAAELAAAEGDLRRLEDTNAPAQAQALKDSAPLLQTSGATAETGNALAAGDLAAAAAAMAELGEQAQDLSPEEQQALATRLNELAAQQQAANPELASALAAAAAALASGNPAAAAESLNNAGAAIQAIANAQAANSAAASASTALASTRHALGDPGESSSRQGSGSAGGTPTSGQGSGGSGSAQGTPQAGSGQSGSGSGSSSGTPSAGGGQSGSAGGNMSQSGQVSGSSAQTTSGGTNSGNAQPRQGEDGTTGTREEEPIYAPSTHGGTQGQEDFIAGIEGPGNEETSAQTGTGAVTDATVPYSTVYGEYERQASRDIDQGAVPPALQPYVRDYFSALEPGSGSEEEAP